MTAGGMGVGAMLSDAWERLRLALQRPEPESPTALPRRPLTREEVPGAAWSALQAACGELALERMLVIPPSMKRPPKGSWLPATTRVVAFGSGAVGQWIDDGDVGRVEAEPLEDLLAIDDRTVLLHGRLSLIGSASSLVIQYNAAARGQFAGAVTWLRQAVAGPDFPLQEAFAWNSAVGDRPRAELPYKWAYMLAHRRDLRLEREAHSAIAVGDVVEQGKSRKGPATGMAILDPHELIVAAEPADRLLDSRYGVDLTVVPRSHLRDVGWNRGRLRIRLRGPDGDVVGRAPAEVTRAIDPCLYAAMRRAFGDLIVWADEA